MPELTWEQKARINLKNVDTSRERWIEFRPAYDCIVRQPCVHGSDQCKPGTGGSHGRHSVDMTWFVRGPEGVVQFKVYTGWMLDDTPERAWGMPMAADLGYHSPTPQWDGQEDYGTMECHLLPQGECYYDGSGLNAEEPWRLLREEGSDAVWSCLDDYYDRTFEMSRMPVLRNGGGEA